ncbi:chemotaxis protein [Vibrio parahaemolyticus]|uniref:chemotaxis protein n=1 Tax=Vibrio parahaemolyticus TaxID=670 RepID=UPI001D164CA2|nr:chemotaxis protein [Vibrio parahaemolyticus]EJG1072857.1 chemotaxis protein [Vibrio parahaemolyticus O1:K56]ELA7196555.1 chemotaxis protein [Vibrio parahaemolyticus]EME0859560.1 chemotaxis protein [Vibrio parahaemolyticus]MCC3795223.1 chemotaxis protein [Vibrio parahaemolyticus]MCC3811380.1 chemotaxis protein [Vibrio parahaemolyticus]
MGSSKSKSSNTSNTTNVSGQNAISGDNLGVAISGVNNSTINTTMTDHGAVTAAIELGGEMLNSNERISLEAMDTTHDIAETAIDEVVDFAGSSLATYASTNSENLDMLAGLAGNQAAQNSKNLEAMMDLAKFKQDGGQVETSKMMVVLAIVLVLVLGYVMVKKR